MVDGLLINGQDAFDTYGAIMGDDFLNQLDAPAPLKDFITFDSRTANGTEYLIKDSSNNPYARVKARDLTLKFRLFGAETIIDNYTEREATIEEQRASLQTRKAALLSLLQSGVVRVKVPALNGGKSWKLLYTGQSVTYDINAQRTSCLLGAKFVEPDPTDHFRAVPDSVAIAEGGTVSTGLSFEKNTGTVTASSPNPDITASVRGTAVTISVGEFSDEGRNLLVAKSARVGTEVGITAKLVEDGWFKISGKSTAQQSIILRPWWGNFTEENTIAKDGIYTLTIESNEKALDSYLYVQAYSYASGGSTDGRYITKSSVGSITLDLTGRWLLRVCLFKGASSNGLIYDGKIRLKLEKGETATPFSIAPEDAVTPVTLTDANGDQATINVSIAV